MFLTPDLVMPLPRRLISVFDWFILSPCAIPPPPPPRLYSGESALLPCGPSPVSGSTGLLLLDGLCLSFLFLTDSHISGVTPLTSWLDQMLDSDSAVILRKPALAAQALSEGLGYLWRTDRRSISLFHEDPLPPEAWESQLWFWTNDFCISLAAPWQRIGDCWSIPTAPQNAMGFPYTDSSHSWELASSTMLLGTVIFRNTAATPTLLPVPRRPDSEAIIQPSLCPTHLPCPAFQGTISLQLCSGLWCACGMSPGNECFSSFLSSVSS